MLFWYKLIFSNFIIFYFFIHLNNVLLESSRINNALKGESHQEKAMSLWRIAAFSAD